MVEKILVMFGIPPCSASHLRQLRPRCRQLVHALAANQHQGVPGIGGQEPGLPQLLYLVHGYDFIVFEGIEDAQRGRLMQRRYLVGMHHLEQLDGPFDIRQPTAPQLGMGIAVRAARQALIVNARLHATNVTNGLLAHALRRITESIHHGEETLANVLITRHKGSAEQRLHLPRLAPL